MQNIPKNNSIALLHSIVGIAKSFDLKVIAEGVETEEQLKVLDAISCDELQGYLFSRPIPGKQLEQGLLSGLFSPIPGKFFPRTTTHDATDHPHR